MNRIRLDALANRVQSAGRRLRAGDGGDPNPAWSLRRGDHRYTGTFDVIGNFPGYEEVAGLIVNAEVTVTTRFLIVDEGAPHGFALGAGWLIDVSADPDPETFGDVLVRYRADDANVLFRLRPSRSRLPMRSRGKPEELIAALSDAGVEPADLARDVASALRLSWDSLQSLESEAVVWRGQATAPLRPGLECAPASLWVTPTAIVWGSPKGMGVNRLPISTVSRLAAATLNDEAESPAVYIRTRMISDVRLDLPFIFNMGPVRDNITSRAAFLALFRSDAVIDASVSNRPQPWLEDLPEPIDDAPVGLSEVEGDEDAASEEHPDEDQPAAEPEEPQFETWANVTKPTAFPYVSPAEGGGTMLVRRTDGNQEGAEGEYDSSGTRLVDAISSWPGASPGASEPEEPSVPVVTEPNVILTYLATAQQSISEVNEAIDRRAAGNSAPPLRATPPSADDQAHALAELIELASSDYYSPEQARSVKARITRLGEAAVRLRSLIELCNAGHLTIHEVGTRRDTIMASLPAVADEE